MSFTSTLDMISLYSKNDKKTDLSYMKKLMDSLNNPQDSLRFIHVAGTNGKGSTVSYVSNILTEQGYITGVYTSPHVERWNERIKVSNHEITEIEFSDLAFLIQNKVEELEKQKLGEPTMFEFLTAMAFLYFRNKGCEIVVLETGMGGRVDPTNIVSTTILSVITKISEDHISYLGNSVSTIAKEKAGIIKKGTPVVLYPQEYEIESVVKNHAENLGSTVLKADFDKIQLFEKRDSYQTFSYKEHSGLRIHMLGKHQLENASIAIEVVSSLSKLGYEVRSENIRKGLANTRWPGRTEVLNEKPLVILDGAHNLDGIKVLLSSLKAYFPKRNLIMIYGGAQNKDNEQMIEMIAKQAKTIYFIPYDHPTAASVETLMHIGTKYMENVFVCSSIKQAIEESMHHSTEEDYVCVAGSLYYINQFKKIFTILTDLK
ncbi:bifunctional folylpolyglutamate synthase/dihydrofolate synthase [Paenibacillus sp. S33]